MASWIRCWLGVRSGSDLRRDGVLARAAPRGHRVLAAGVGVDVPREHRLGRGRRAGGQQPGEEGEDGDEDDVLRLAPTPASRTSDRLTRLLAPCCESHIALVSGDRKTGWPLRPLAPECSSGPVGRAPRTSQARPGRRCIRARVRLGGVRPTCPRPPRPARRTARRPRGSPGATARRRGTAPGSLHRLERAVRGVAPPRRTRGGSRTACGGGTLTLPPSPTSTRSRVPSQGGRRRRRRTRRRRRSGRSCPTSSGRCCASVPPCATAITCMPRQMPSTGSARGRPRPRAARAPTRHGTVRQLTVCGSARRRSGGVDVRPAA